MRPRGGGLRTRPPCWPRAARPRIAGTMLARYAVPSLAGLDDRFADGGDFLDVGVGVAEIAAAFCEALPAARVVGLDVLPQAVALARSDRCRAWARGSRRDPSAAGGGARRCLAVRSGLDAGAVPSRRDLPGRSQAGVRGVAFGGLVGRRGRTVRWRRAGGVGHLLADAAKRWHTTDLGPGGPCPDGCRVRRGDGDPHTSWRTCSLRSSKAAIRAVTAHERPGWSRGRRNDPQRHGRCDHDAHDHRWLPNHATTGPRTRGSPSHPPRRVRGSRGARRGRPRRRHRRGARARSCSGRGSRTRPPGRPHPRRSHPARARSARGAT